MNRRIIAGTAAQAKNRNKIGLVIKVNPRITKPMKSMIGSTAKFNSNGAKNQIKTMIAMIPNAVVANKIGKPSKRTGIATSAKPINATKPAIGKRSKPAIPVERPRPKPITDENTSGMLIANQIEKPAAARRPEPQAPIKNQPISATIAKIQPITGTRPPNWPISQIGFVKIRYSTNHPMLRVAGSHDCAR